MLFGSQTGNAMDAAERVGREAKYRGFTVRVLPADCYMNMIDKLPTEDVVIFVMSTTGQGEFPDTCCRFWKFLRKKSLARDSLCTLSCGVFGLGDSGYPKYNYSAKLIHKRLGALGAKFLVPLGLGDDQHTHGYDASLDIWLSQLWHALGATEPLNGYNCKLQTKICVERAPTGKYTLGTQELSSYHDSILVGSSLRKLEEMSWHESTNMDIDHFISPVSTYMTVFSTQVLGNRRVTAADHFQDVRLLTIHLPSGPTIHPGDAIGIWPRQSLHDIKIILDRCGMKYDDVVRVSYHNANDAEEEDSRQSFIAKAGNLIEGFIDIRGAPPRRTFLQAMAQLSPEGMYKDRLLHLASSRGRGDFHEYIMEEGRNLIEVLQDFPSVPVDLEWILSYGPKLQCRYYSACSYQRDQKDPVDILAALVEWKTPGRRLRKGLCSKTLSQASPGDELLIEIAQSDLKYLPNSTPLILIGPGTGVAPLRSFLQERHAKLQESVSSIGPSILFYGCRDRTKDYYFQDEWNSMISEGVLEQVIVAASRENSSRMYVQDALVKHGDLVWKYIRNGAHIYVCGRAGTMPGSVEKALYDILCTHGKRDLSEAKKIVSERQHVECWN